MSNVSGLFDSIKAKVEKGENLTVFECLCIQFTVIAVTTKLIHDWFGISPKKRDNVDGDDNVKNI